MLMSPMPPIPPSISPQTRMRLLAWRAQRPQRLLQPGVRRATPEPEAVRRRRIARRSQDPRYIEAVLSRVGYRGQWWLDLADVVAGVRASGCGCTHESIPIEREPSFNPMLARRGRAASDRPAREG